MCISLSGVHLRERASAGACNRELASSRCWQDGGLRSVHHGPQGEDHYLEKLPRRRADDGFRNFQVSWRPSDCFLLCCYATEYVELLRVSSMRRDENEAPLRLFAQWSCPNTRSEYGGRPMYGGKNLQACETIKCYYT